ncbi:TSUP family transporter [Sinorhizobium meliloti]|uniref:Probable membrane transporter protein n=1 Tax=Rhizobium meliloti (strain 1021) TaxID=266834 RepID=Q92ZC2_RHIME|nr:TSUP family transporter [Sinorhizobium meliloti]AAK65226.1 Hypothetical protein SMa1050 [Sinorhizobium meliloti 1021]AGG70250.1 Hypothetical protein SM2011_a1050 [Sinorhizobium meliloti 2011]ASP60358.1 anion permease [Sinorhizobium meliloti]MCK3803107.1 sulfite exporter TauE/SafE family protein [Sinorhizobium meliloti]MCK3808931.1 sulfite exporter TauE/SafE family protein [Sinorhizobium meliloti]
MSTSILAAVGSGGIVGFMLGLLGGGGSILATPLLLYVVGVTQPHVAIGTGALAVSVNAFANFASHAIKGHVWWRCAAVFSALGVLGALGGSSLGKAMDGDRLIFLFGILMVVVIGGGIVGGVLGMLLATRLSAYKNILHRLFAALIFVVAAYILYQSARQAGAHQSLLDPHVVFDGAHAPS